MNAITFRAAVTDDIDSVLQFWNRAAEDAHRPPDTAAALNRLIERDPEALTLACQDGRIVGTVIAGWDGWRCHIHRLAVDPDRRRSGIGRALVALAEHRFRSAGAIRADAMVLEDNDPGHHTWVALGYARQDEWARWVKPLADPR